MKLWIFRVVSVILLLCLMVGIFWMSGQNADDSQDLSDGFTLKLFRIIVPHFKEMSIEKQREFLQNVFVSIRKVAHFGLYFIMGILACFSVITYKGVKPEIRIIGAFLICALYSVSDEYHQIFIPGRSGEIRDVLIDSGGAALSILILSGLCFAVKKIRKKLF